MKKLILLCTVVCAGQLYSMEPQANVRLDKLEAKLNALVNLLGTYIDGMIKDTVGNPIGVDYLGNPPFGLIITAKAKKGQVTSYKLKSFTNDIAAKFAAIE